MNKLKDLCMLLLEEAIDDPTKRSWEDVFGAMAPVCEEFLNFKPDGSGSGDRRPPKGDGSGDRPPKGDGSGDRPPTGDGSGDRPPKGDGSGDDGMPPVEERRLGKVGSKGGDRRPPKGDGSGDRPPKGGDVSKNVKVENPTDMIGKRTQIIFSILDCSKAPFSLSRFKVPVHPGLMIRDEP